MTGTHGIYTVTGNRNYRGHKPGYQFIAHLEPLAEARAIQRGDIALIERLTPTLPPNYQLPAGWLHNQTGRE